MAWPCAGAFRLDARSSLLRVGVEPDAVGEGAWDVTTNQMTGGSPSVNVAVPASALVAGGEIRQDFRSSAGVIWMLGEQHMQPVGFSGREAIRFQTRGTGGRTRRY